MVKRYDFIYDPLYGHKMKESISGDYITYKDFSALQSLNAEMMKIIKRDYRYMVERGVSHEYAIMKDNVNFINKMKEINNG